MVRESKTRIHEGRYHMAIVNVDENNFEEQILQAGETTLVDFYADWCSHCRTIAPMLDQLSGEKQIRIAKVNVDESPRLAEQYKIMAIPALLLFQDGKVTGRKTGGVTKGEILEMMQ